MQRLPLKDIVPVSYSIYQTACSTVTYQAGTARPPRGVFEGTAASGGYLNGSLLVTQRSSYPKRRCTQLFSFGRANPIVCPLFFLGVGQSL